MCAFTIKYLFDYDAVNEAVLNALVHNDWTITEPQISVFSDRMEILSHIWHSNREEVRKFMMKRTISGMIGAGSLAHNRRDFVAENVDPDRAQLNICYKNENLKEVYKELFDDAVERYNVEKRKDRQIANYYEKIRHFGYLAAICNRTKLLRICILTLFLM